MKSVKSRFVRPGYVFIESGRGLETICVLNARRKITDNIKRQIDYINQLKFEVGDALYEIG